MICHLGPVRRHPSSATLAELSSIC